MGAEIAVVFYAGHGIEVDKRNFLVPVDARLLSGREVEIETVTLGLVILDACRDNPFAASMRRAGAERSIGRGLARVESSGEMLVAYAAKEGTLASDGARRNPPGHSHNPRPCAAHSVSPPPSSIPRHGPPASGRRSSAPRRASPTRHGPSGLADYKLIIAMRKWEISDELGSPVAIAAGGSHIR